MLHDLSHSRPVSTIHMLNTPHFGHPDAQTHDIVQGVQGSANEERHSSRAASPTRSLKLFSLFSSPNKIHTKSLDPVSPDDVANFEPPFDDGCSPVEVQKKPSRLDSWFSGTSAPIKLSLIPTPAKEEKKAFFDFSDTSAQSSTTSLAKDGEIATNRPPTKLHKTRSGTTSPGIMTSTSNKLASWISRPATPTDSGTYAEKDLLEINVQKALAVQTQSDETHRVELQKLHENAEQLVSRLQQAYIMAIKSARKAKSEKHVLSDELEACETKSENLTLQLENMALKMAEQESAMQSMAAELAASRFKLRQNADFRQKSLRMVPMKPWRESCDLINMEQERSRRSSYTSFVDDCSSVDSLSSTPSSCSRPSSSPDLHT